MVFRFLLRYILMAVRAYVILTVSPASLNGLLAGLFLPVAAILCEAGYEVYAALIRGVWLVRGHHYKAWSERQSAHA